MNSAITPQMLQTMKDTMTSTVQEKEKHTHYADRDGNVAVLPITKRKYRITVNGNWVRIKPQL